MAVPIPIRYLWNKWIQACWINQGYGEGRRCVSVYSSKKVACTELCELDIADDHIECVLAKHHLNGQTYIVGVVYRPPNSNIVDFNNTMHSTLEKVIQYPCYIMGDFNLDLLKHEKHPPTEIFFISCMLILSYQSSTDPQEWRGILVLWLIIYTLITTT